MRTTTVVLLATLFWLPLSTYAAPTRANAASKATGAYPVGIPSSSEPSGMSPPGPSDLAGYTESYVNDFTTNALPIGWDIFSGVPGGDPGGHFATPHVQFSGGLLRLNAWRDVNFQNRWVTGGICQCGLSRVYGAYFVRSRETGPGPNEVQLLWPVTNTWPPEIDFNETGASDVKTTETVHYGAQNTMDHGNIQLNMLKWHTWGVIWTASSVTFVIDGRVWARDTTPTNIPNIPMDLNLEQRALCTVGRQCPKKNVSMLVDWVAEYIPGTDQSTTTTTTGTTSTTTSSTSTTTTTTMP